MALNLDGTTGITSDSGTPVIENLNTTDTGIDITGQLTTTGNVVVGVTPSDWGGAYKVLQTTGASMWGSSNVGHWTLNNYFDGSNYRYIADGAATDYYQFSGSHIWRTAPSGTAGDTVTHTESMRIDSNGNLLVGTTAALSGAPVTPSIYTGSLFVNKTSTVTGHSSVINLEHGGGYYYGIMLKNGVTATSNALSFINSSNVSVGRVTVTTTATSYVTSSDYRLKEDWQPITGATERVKALKPVNFAWKADGSRVDGFLAHEAQAVVPEAVTGEKDAMRDEEYEVTPAVLDDDGNVVTPAVMGTRSVPDYQGIDQSKLVPLLTAALQEALAEINDLKARVSALEAANV